MACSCREVYIFSWAFLIHPLDEQHNQPLVNIQKLKHKARTLSSQIQLSLTLQENKGNTAFEEITYFAYLRLNSKAASQSDSNTVSFLI